MGMGTGMGNEERSTTQIVTHRTPTTTDVYWYTNHVSSSASIHGQFYKRTPVCVFTWHSANSNTPPSYMLQMLRQGCCGSSAQQKLKLCDSLACDR
jgi:hypothetical protein